MHATTEATLTHMGSLPGLLVKYNSLGYILAIFVFIGVAKVIYYLFYAYRMNMNANYRNFIRLNIIAFIIIYGTSLTLGVILPLFDIPSQLYASSFFPIAVIIFYVAILRYQFARVDELNVNLERKVEERTAELKDAYTRMVQTEKMASLGQLVAGVAHEINNPIGAISSSQQSMSSSIEKLTKVMGKFTLDDKQNSNVNRSLEVLKKTSGIISNGSERIAEIVVRLKQFAKLDEAEQQKVNINDGIKETLALLEHDLQNRFIVKSEFADLPKINCNPRQLNQVWLNLIINAVEMQPAGGGEINIITSLSDNMISVEIDDDGPGISKTDSKRIFDPGFTTKSRGTGTGLGLAICYRIIEAHNGRIEVQSDGVKGTRFRVLLPII